MTTEKQSRVLEWLTQNRKWMVRVAYRRISIDWKVDLADAEDVVQVASFRAFAKADMFKGLCPIRAWCFRVLKGECARYRLKQRLLSRQSEFCISEWEQLGVALDLVSLLDKKLCIKKIAKLFGSEETSLLLQGFDMDEIASILKEEPVYLRLRLARAKAEMAVGLFNYPLVNKPKLRAKRRISA